MIKTKYKQSQIQSANVFARVVEERIRDRSAATDEGD